MWVVIVLSHRLWQWLILLFCGCVMSIVSSRGHKCFVSIMFCNTWTQFFVSWLSRVSVWQTSRIIYLCTKEIPITAGFVEPNRTFQHIYNSTDLPKSWVSSDWEQKKISFWNPIGLRGKNWWQCTYISFKLWTTNEFNGFQLSIIVESWLITKLLWIQWSSTTNRLLLKVQMLLISIHQPNYATNWSVKFIFFYYVIILFN